MVRLAGLEIGQLLSMTARLSNVVAYIGSAEAPRLVSEEEPATTNGQREQLCRRSTMLQALSCCFRLEVIFSNALDALQQVQKSGKPLEDSHRLMPGLAVDGFSLGTCQDLQLRFAIQLCEQAVGIIRRSTSRCDKTNSAALADIGDALGKLLTH